MSEKFEVTKEAILAMVEKCPEAKTVLKAGFPGAFKGNDKYFDLDRLSSNHRLFTDSEAMAAGFHDSDFFGIRTASKNPDYNGTTFFLDRNYNWAIKRGDGEYFDLLIPTRKD